ncbi:MAG: SMC-Scp complex subunit ScpB [Proteobacteria bacterium]|nr:SMC-Scp complex subunit ScpB [Pseudomonadota bacterium]
MNNPLKEKYGPLPIVEAMIFSSENPLSAEKIASILELNKEDVEEIIKILMKEYNHNEMHGIEIVEIGGGYFFRTKIPYAPFIRKIVMGKESDLSKSAMETLAIIAYKQPITRAEIEHIRGVDSSNPIRSLLEKKLIKIQGRKDVPGRPHVYGTTKEFLKAFGLKDLSELPNIKEIKEIIKEPQLKLIGEEDEDKTSENNS